MGGAWGLIFLHIGLSCQISKETYGSEKMVTVSLTNDSTNKPM